MKKAISKINPFRYAKKLHIGYIWLIAVLLLLVVGVICSGAKVYKYKHSIFLFYMLFNVIFKLQYSNNFLYMAI